jgi:hypothetical protein
MANIIKSDCKHLKTKKSFVPDQIDPERWRTNKSTTSQYWCTKTMGVTGPDGGLAEPEGCLNHRNCFVTIKF